MIIQGLHNTAVIYTEKMEESAIKQIQAMCDSDIFANLNIRIMPDVHTGSSCTIGTTMTIQVKLFLIWSAWTLAVAWLWLNYPKKSLTCLRLTS